jgi:hypothetical protein
MRGRELKCRDYGPPGLVCTQLLAPYSQMKRHVVTRRIRGDTVPTRLQSDHTGRFRTDHDRLVFGNDRRIHCVIVVRMCYEHIIDRRRIHVSECFVNVLLIGFDFSQ